MKTRLKFVSATWITKHASYVFYFNAFMLNTFFLLFVDFIVVTVVVVVAFLYLLRCSILVFSSLSMFYVRAHSVEPNNEVNIMSGPVVHMRWVISSSYRIFLFILLHLLPAVLCRSHINICPSIDGISMKRTQLSISRKLFICRCECGE